MDQADPRARRARPLSDRLCPGPQSVGKIAAMRGATAGTLGVVAMVGVITTLRRWLLSSEQLASSQTHPEKMVQRLSDIVGTGTLEDRDRRRLGDAVHFGYGAMWGIVLDRLSRSREVRISRDGLALGLGLWAFGFNVLLPALGAHPGTWTWRRREFVLTLSAHVAYGLTTAAALRGLRR